MVNRTTVLPLVELKRTFEYYDSIDIL